ncbi:MAG: FHA domain-containing protein, partial [Myxococcota bacterium]
MGFVLRVTEGAGEGEEFSFEGGDVRLGRTADNDVVIKDPSSSRSHCRIFEKGGARFVEDMKSANGTEVNGQPLTKPHQLTSGDRIGIGDVVLEYETDEVDPNATLLKPPDSTVDESGEDPNATILKPPQPPPSRRTSPAPRDGATRESKAIERPSRAVKRP